MNKIFIDKLKYSTILMLLFASVSMLATGCGPQSQDNSISNLPPASPAVQRGAGSGGVNAGEQADDASVGKRRRNARDNMVDINVELEENFGKMITYEVPYMGRGNPFMPYAEELEFQNARSSAIREANEKNAQIIKMKKLKDIAVREPDDISPYSFNLPVPPTSSGAGSQAATITKTKVVGIMYNAKSPSAIINVDNKDYLVRPGDKIIGQEYIVTKINETWVTAAMGSNVYSAAIGELFSKDSVQENQTDIYDLKNRFGGRKI